MKAWVDKYGFKKLTKFVSYMAKYHNNNALIHNNLIKMIDDAAAIIR